MNTSGFDTGAHSSAASSAPADTPAHPRPLRRAYHGRMLAGVAAGIAGYLDVDVTIVRLAFVVLTLLGGAGIPAYLAGTLLIPEEGSDESLASSLIGSVQHQPSREA
jgi:phage shock protein PspC (stress-responsive transcriptional regulator)